MSLKGLTVEIVRDIAAQCGLLVDQSLVLPAREAEFAPAPAGLHPSVITGLLGEYPSGLYRHQALALDALLAGSDVSLSTSTASGKTLVFLCAAMDVLFKNPGAKVLALYPAKALIRDQIDKWERATRRTAIRVGLIDGSVPMDRRGEILTTNRIVLATPDVIHAWFMSNLRDKTVARFRSSLRLLILDEAHVYEGVFGTNMAYLMRRLDAVTSDCRVLCSTATLGRPSDFIYQLTGRRAVSIGQEKDGSAAPLRHVLLARDPGYDRLVELLKRLATVDGGRFLAFSDSRKMVEQIVAATMRAEEVQTANDDEADSELDEDSEEQSVSPDFGESSTILPFRAGYETDDARQIQSALWSGRLGGVVSTSAMELGIDIGEIDLVVLLGIPPSLKAFWQRLGRAGRRRDGVCLVIDTKGAITGAADGLARYVTKALEPSWLYLENRYLQYANVLCAALESSELGLAASDRPPFGTLPSTFRRLLENELNPTEVVPADLYPLKQRAQAGPHREFPLRSGIERDFKIRTPDGQSLGNVSFSQMMREAYPGALYYYMARPYRVVRMDVRDGYLSVRRTKYWTTKPNGNTMVFPRFNGGVLSLFGSAKGFLAEAELQVSERVSGFQEMRGRTRLAPHQYGPASTWYRRELTRFFETTGVCLCLNFGSGAMDAIGTRLVQAFCLDLGVQERDIGFGLFHAKQDPFGNSELCQGLCIYDAVDGSLRLTQRLAENFADVVRAAASYSEAEGSADIAEQLKAIYVEFSEMEPKSISSGRMIELGGDSGSWTEVIASGERAMYTSDDGSREVGVVGYRFTPKGLMYELVPEKGEGNGRWMVSDRAVQPLNGFTRMIWVDLITGDESDEPPNLGGRGM